jgi:prevent-host-death family protein
MKNIIGLKEFRQNVESYSNRVSKGETLVIFKRSKPLFKIVPISEEETWETIIDFTEIDKNGVPIEKIIKAISNGQNSKSSSKATKKI